MSLPPIRFLLSLALLAVVATFGTDVVRAGDGLPDRVPGTVVLRGDPDGVGDWRIVQAFPNLRFRRPLWIGHPPDGTDRLFVMEQDGVVHSFPNRRDVKQAERVLDFRDRVYRGHNEEGLLGLAFHPGFAENRLVFIHYSANRPRRGVVSRFQMNRAGTKIDRRTERVILTQPQPWGNHNGGDLQFGPDGYLYVTFGDGGAANDPRGSGQNLGNWLASILRIDVDGGEPYAVPKDNPFVGVPGARPEIWAYGLRNVWRMSFDRRTGDLWGGDVGQNRWEEIDVIRRGGNYGWSLREGAHRFRQGGEARADLIEPVIDFDTSLARSITGGYVYRGRKLPDLRGVYLYADYVTGNVWGLRWDGEKLLENRLLARGRDVSTFGEDQAGEVYFASFDGRIYTFERGEPSRFRFPRKLSETGLFADVARHVPQPFLVPYDVNVPLWSDGARKERFVMLPALKRVRVDDAGHFTFPRGTIFVKTFYVGASAADGRRLETRLFVKRRAGWAGFTYVWDAAQGDAELAQTRTHRDSPEALQRHGLANRWTFPGRSDCMRCHTAAGGRVLGFRSEQLDREIDHGGEPVNQLDALAAIGLFDTGRGALRRRPAWPDWTDESASLDGRVRAYLDANCAMCHQPDGPGNARIDLRKGVSLADMRLIGEAPGQGNLGVAGAKLVVPGDRHRSLLWLRMARTDDAGMPSFAHNGLDRKGLDLLGRWIDALADSK